MSETAEVPAGQSRASSVEGLRDCVVILNAGAGTLLGDENAHDGLEEAFRRNGLRPIVRTCRDGGDIEDFVREALGRNIDTVVAGGGDGTVNAVASQLIGTDARLGVLPLGTLNHFAKDLGLPLDRDEAIAVIATGDVDCVDVGEVNGSIFINNSSLGLYPLAVHLREKEQERGTGKWFALAKASIKVLGRYPLLRVHLDIDGKRIVRRTPIVFIGNNHYELEGLEMSKRQRLDGGVLSICVTRDVGRFGLFGLVLRALFGRLRDSEDFAVIEGTEVCIETQHAKMRVATDGEVNEMNTPLKYCSRKGALQVIVPRTQPTKPVSP